MSASRCSITNGASGAACPPRAAIISASRPRPAGAVDSIALGTLFNLQGAAARPRRRACGGLRLSGSCPRSRLPDCQHRLGLALDRDRIVVLSGVAGEVGEAALEEPVLRS